MSLPVRSAHPKVPRADRLLVIRLGAVGDVVRTLPSVQALRTLYPGAHLAWLVEPASAGVVEASGLVDETLVFPRSDLVEALRAGDGLSLLRLVGRFLRRLRRRRFELVLDFHGILKSGLLARASGAPRRVGYARGIAREGAWLFVRQRVRLRNPVVSRYERNAALVEALAPGVRVPDTLRIEPSPLAQARLSARLRITGREQAAGFVLIHPGTSAGASHKRYPPAAWAEVARRLVAQGAAVWVVAGTGRDERSLVDRVIRESGGVALPAPETRSFDDLLALLDRSSVFVAADTGPLHAASLAGVPVVQLLGPTDPVQNRPWSGTPSRRLHVPLPCSPCRRGCARPVCMKVLPPDAVADAILELQSESGRRLARLGDERR